MFVLFDFHKLTLFKMYVLIGSRTDIIDICIKIFINKFSIIVNSITHNYIHLK